MLTKLKSLMAVCAIAASATLAGCVSTGNAQLDANIAAAQGIMATACGIEATAVEIASIVSSSPIIPSADAIAKIVCAAVAGPAKSGKYGAPYMAVSDTRQITVNLGDFKARMTVRRIR